MAIKKRLSQQGLIVHPPVISPLEEIMGAFLVYNRFGDSQKIVVPHEDYPRIKTAKIDLFRTCYPADNPAGRQTAREYRKLSGGFFCRFRSKYACILRCRGPPRKSESPSHLDFRRERNAKNSSV